MGRLNTSLNRVIIFDKVCRACMMEKVGLRPIFNLNIADNLMSIAAVKIKQNDELPSKICSDCLKKLQYSIVFKQKVEKADSVLRKYHNMRKKKAESENDVEENQELDKVGSDNKTELENVSFSNTDHEYTQRVRQSSRLAKKANFKLKTLKGKSKILHELIQFDKETSDDEKEQPPVKITAVNIFSDGPPPLVPLVPIAPEEIPTFPVEKKTPPVAIALKPISDETPPLVPLKPIIPGLEELAIITKDIVKPKFSCQICYEEFSDPLKLKGHMSIHSQENRLTCNICKKEFNDSKRLIGHLKGHMVVKRYECKFCGKRYPNPSTFKVHMRSHTGERPYKCPTCGKGFVRWAAVAVHMKCHESSTPYRCELCKRGFKLASNLERHKVIHTGSMPYICSYCGKTFTQNDNLQLHVRTYHTFERPYLCSKCGKGFVSATRLNRHMWTHSGKKQYTCRTCNKGYANLNDLRNHMKIHGMQGDDSKRYACEVCDLRFYHKCRLARHIKVHERPHICAVCNKTFSREELLMKHMTMKHGVGGEGDVQQEPVIDIDIVEHVKIESSDGLVFQRY